MIKTLEDQFTELFLKSKKLVETVEDGKLYKRLLEQVPLTSVGENVIRSSNVVEQFAGGITRRLWDDPWEWSLPESLSQKTRLLEYLETVEKERKKAFEFLKTDDEISRELPAPEEFKTIGEVIFSTLRRAEHYLARAELIEYYLRKNGGL